MADVPQQIRARANEFCDALAKGETEKIAAMYTDDYTIIGQGDTIYRGKGGVEEHLKVAGTLGVVRVEFVEERYEAGGLADGVAFHTGVWVAFNKDNQKISMFKDLVIWKKVDGIWKVYRELGNYY